MIKLIYYPEPTSTEVWFTITCAKAGIQKVEIEKWFELDNIVTEANHQLPTCKTSIKENQYVQLRLFFESDSEYIAVFYRRKDEVILCMKDDHISVYQQMYTTDTQEGK